MFGDDGFGCDERLALSLIIDGRHAELILFSLVQSRDVALRCPAVLTDRSPLARLLVLLLHDVMTDRLPAVVLSSANRDVSSTTLQYTMHPLPNMQSRVAQLTDTTLALATLNICS